MLWYEKYGVRKNGHAFFKEMYKEGDHFAEQLSEN